VGDISVSVATVEDLFLKILNFVPIGLSILVEAENREMECVVEGGGGGRPEVIHEISFFLE
jgi:hypothetical protein